MKKPNKNLFRILKIILLFMFLAVISGIGLLVFKTAGVI